MTDATHVVDGDATEIPGTELEPHVSSQHTGTLFHTDDPVEVVERASRVADALKGVLDKQGLTANISGKRHVLVEGWTTLGAMVGVTAVPVWTKPLEGDAPQGRSFGFEARVEARTLDGRVIGAAEAMCTRNERRWKSADDYAIRSMAQTRATSKALRGPLGFVVTLAGYESTPAEEMPATAAKPDDAPPAEKRDMRGEPLTKAQYDALLAAFVEAGSPHLDLIEHLDACLVPREPQIGMRIKHLSRWAADDLLAWLQQQRKVQRPEGEGG